MEDLALVSPPSWSSFSAVPPLACYLHRKNTYQILANAMVNIRKFLLTWRQKVDKLIKIFDSKVTNIPQNPASVKFKTEFTCKRFNIEI